MPIRTTKPATVQPGFTPEPTGTYASAYARFASIAERLKTAGAATSVDTLVEDVRAVRAAHALCRARLAGVRAEIEAELTSAGENETVPDARP